MSNAIKLSLISVALLSQLNAEQIVELTPLTITSTAIQTDELKSTDAVEVYTAKDIDKAKVQNVYEFLNKNTSLTTMPGYGNTYMQKIDMRGYGIGDGYQNIVITLNGRRLNNVDMVPQLLGSIPTSSIDKIEIIKSSGIVIGGDGANAGVINITTKKSNDKEITLYGGTYGLLDGSVYLGHSDEKLSLSLSAEHQQHDIIRDIDPSSPIKENKLSTAAFDLSYLATDALELRLNAALTNTDNVYAGALSKADYEDDPTKQGASTTIQEYDTKSYSLGLSYFFTDDIEFNLDGYKEDKNSKYNYVTWSFESEADYEYNAIKTDFQYSSENLSLIAGYDLYNSQRDTTANSISKESNAGYLMSLYNLANSTIKAGLRYEAIKFKSDGGDNQDDNLWGAELGYNNRLNSDMSIFVNYSHSYQSADLDRLFSYSTGAFNGYVKPSEANNFNLGFNYILKSNKFKISLYYADLENEIYYYADPTYLSSRNTNIDKSHKYGLDLYDQYVLNEQLNFILNYNYTQAIIDEEKENGDDYAGNKLPGVSDHNIKVALNYLPMSTTSVSLSHVYRSAAYAANDFNNNFSQKQDAYNSTDISVTYTQESWEIFAKINNLFDTKNGIWIKDNNIYPVNFTRTAMAGLKVKF